MRVLVTGASGLLGRNLVRRLKGDGHHVVAADFNPERAPRGADKLLLGRDGDCTVRDACHRMCDDVDQVYHLARSRYDDAHSAAHNFIMDFNIMEAAETSKVLLASKASVYNTDYQKTLDVEPLKESDVWPARPEGMQGLAKLHSEAAYENYREEYKTKLKIVRLFNIYGPGHWSDALVPSLCYQMATNHPLLINGDGKQVRTYLYVDDAVDALVRLMAAEFTGPINLGHSFPISVNDLATKLACIAGVTPAIKYRPDVYSGVRGRCPDITKIREVIGWEPATLLVDGLTQTYEWIAENVNAA